MCKQPAVQDLSAKMPFAEVVGIGEAVKRSVELSSTLLYVVLWMLSVNCGTVPEAWCCHAIKLRSCLTDCGNVYGAGCCHTSASTLFRPPAKLSGLLRGGLRSVYWVARFLVDYDGTVYEECL